MGIDKKYIGKVTETNLDDWLHSTGFLFPQNKTQIERFNKLYEDYDFKLKNTGINVKSIIDGSFMLKKNQKLYQLTQT
jgi:phage antirepressor YoqD-like protein